LMVVVVVEATTAKAVVMKDVAVTAVMRAVVQVQVKVAVSEDSRVERRGVREEA